MEERKAIIARFAQMEVRETQRRRLQLSSKTRQPIFEEDSESWRTEVQKANWETEQLAYTEPYKAEYQDLTNSVAANTAQEDEVPSGTSVIEDSASSVADNDTISSLLTITKNRRLRARAAASTRGSVIDFERTSTIQPPSEINQEDYTSNVNVDDLRKDFFSNYKSNTTLPTYSYRSYLINSIQSYNVVIIEGATGCGKTTQVPVYILEDAILDRKQPKSPVVYVTQPRRIAARSIARRVCEEHGWELGSIVGYQVGLDKCIGPQTVLVFCTAGVLLQKLIQEKTLTGYTHIIIDEAHERDADTDLLLMMIRTLMRNEMSFFRLIVMSATMDIGKLKSYFTFKTTYGHNPVTTPSIIKIGHYKDVTNYQVIYYDKLRSTFQVEEPMPVFDLDQPEVHDECLRAAAKIIIGIIPHLDTYSEDTKSTLVFLPGLAEIKRLHNQLKGMQDFLDIIPLHSCFSVKDQARVFEPARAGCRKVILATNIAESSITVRDVGFIIDFCLTKTLRKDNVTRFPTLRIDWSTVDKCTQRAGRTGRCCPGKVFRMVSYNFFKQFEQYAQPELLTAPLELSVLRVKNFQMGEVKALFAVVMDPPLLHEIRTAVLELKQIGALSSTYDGKLSDIDGDLTELGRVISVLPIDVHLSKLIVIAHVLDVLEDAIIVSACLSTNRTVVKNLYENLLESYENKLGWANGSYSDLFVCLDVYKEYIYFKDEQNKGQSWLENFCHNKNLDERKLHEVSALVEELKTRLEGVNIKILDQPNRVRNRCEDELMLKIAFCAAFYPNYFLKEDFDVQDVKKALCGLEPTKTVIIHSFPVNEVPLYRSQVLDQLRDLIDEDLEYISDCSRALILVNGDSNNILEDKSTLEAIGVDGVVQSSLNISRSVYVALKYGEFSKIFIREYNTDAARERMAYYHRKRKELEGFGRLLPSWMNIVKGREVDNSRLELVNNQENPIFTNSEYYIEVSFNEIQDHKDRLELYSLEKCEDEKMRQSNKRDIDGSEHDLYKPDYKRLRGPTSPIQMTFRSVVEKSRGFKVDIDPQSVNSILLDPNYEENRRQMLLAATVSQSKKGRIMVHDTTLMPDIRGLPTLMSLLFAQYYRLVYNQQMNCPAGSIFGLGWDADDNPIDKQYEVELGFDVHITKDDIDLINKGRRTISELIRFLDVQNPGAPRAEMQQQLRQIILTLMRKRRYPINEVSLSSIDWNEGEFMKEKHNVPKDQIVKLEEGKTRVFLPVMEMNKNYSELDLYKAVRDNLDHLDKIESCEAKPPIGGIRCLLCGNGIDNLLLMYNKIVAHNYSESHIHKLREFEIFEERAKQRAEI